MVYILSISTEFFSHLYIILALLLKINNFQIACKAFNSIEQSDTIHCSYISRIPKKGGEVKKVGPERFSRLNGIAAYSSSKIIKGNSHAKITRCVYAINDSR